MVEYASVRSSLYDIDSLVSQLNERAGDGWEVVQILPTGGDVTAVLRRSDAAVDGEAEAEAPATSGGLDALATGAAAGGTVAAFEHEDVVEETTGSDGAFGGEVVTETTEEVSETVSDAADTATDAASDAVDTAGDAVADAGDAVADASTSPTAPEPPSWATAPAAAAADRSRRRARGLGVGAGGDGRRSDDHGRGGSGGGRRGRQRCRAGRGCCGRRARTGRSGRRGGSGRRTDAAPGSCAGDAVHPRRLVPGSVQPVRAALLGRQRVDRARGTPGSDVHRPARRLTRSTRHRRSWPLTEARSPGLRASTAMVADLDVRCEALIVRATSLGHAGILIETRAGHDRLRSVVRARRSSGRGSSSPATTSCRPSCMAKVERPDFLYISHLHADHLDDAFLAEHVDRSTTVLLPGFPTSELERHLRRLGFDRIVATEPAKPIEVGRRSHDRDPRRDVDHRRAGRRLGADRRRRREPPAEPERLPPPRPRRADRARARSTSSGCSSPGAIWYPMVYDMPRRHKRELCHAKVDAQLGAGGPVRPGRRCPGRGARPPARRASSTPSCSAST